MEMLIPCGVRTKISQASDIWRNKGGHRENTAATMPAKRRGNHRSRVMQGSHPYAHKHTAKVQRIEHNGIPKGKEQLNDIRPPCESKIQVW